jgi:hypothetical protein
VLKTYTITASAGTGGNITPSGNVPVNHGANQTFTITPNSGYNISQVFVDGTNNPGAVSSGSYTFNNITANHTINATFVPQGATTYIITATAGAGGNISPSGDVIVTKGANQTFTITPILEYQISQVLVDGVNNQGAVSSGSYTFNNVTDNHTIAATFLKNEAIEDILVNSLQIFPNPVKDVLIIEFEDINLVGEVVIIFDLFGKEMLNEVLSNDNINVSQLPSGVYILKINNYTVKFVKE